MEKDILGNEYVYAIIKKLPEEYQEIAYLYLIKDINNSFALANYFHISKISMDKKLTELKILLRKCYDEMDLSKEELIYYRFIKLLDKDKNYLYDYVNGLSYSYMSKKYRVNEGTIRRSVEKSMEVLNCSFGEIRDMFISKNINMNNLTNTNIDNNKMDYEIINKFADLKERDRKILVARIMQDKLYYKRVLNMYEILPKDASAIYCRIKKNIGYTDNDIEKCFKRNNIFTIYKTLDSKEITTFDLLNNIYNKLPSQISESKYTEILNKYDLLEDLYKKIVYARLSGYSEKEIKEFIKTDVPSLMDKAKSKTESLGNPYEVRLCLSRKLK